MLYLIKSIYKVKQILESSQPLIALIIEASRSAHFATGTTIEAERRLPAVKSSFLSNRNFITDRRIVRPVIFFDQKFPYSFSATSNEPFSW